MISKSIRCLRSSLPPYPSPALSTGSHSVTACAYRPTASALINQLSDSWLLRRPNSEVQQLAFSCEAGQYVICVVRDDLLHPLYGGNKIRKLDGYMPALLKLGVTDLVTCGGLQSAHLTAVAAACAEQGLTCHLLVRGERPHTPTGYHLLSMMYGHVTYVPRSEYADREAMYARHSARVASSLGETGKVAVMEEGAGNPLALLGLIRMVCWMASDPRWGNMRLHLVVDSGTGTTVTGLALGIELLGLPWKVTGIMLAGDVGYYQGMQATLTRAFADEFAEAWALKEPVRDVDDHHAVVEWVPRLTPRRFGKVLPGEIEACKEVARKGGPLLDPIYTLAAWEESHCLASHYTSTNQDWQVMMLHTGGALGLFGLAQRFADEF